VQTHFDVPRRPAVDRRRYLLDACRGRRVLHLGCTDWPLTAERAEEGTLLQQSLLKIDCDLVGLDLDRNGVDYFNTHGLGPCVYGNIETTSLADVGGKPFEVVLAGEIIEHLENPGLFLRACRPLIAPGGVLIITTINAYCSFRILRYLLGREIVHEDHNYYFSPRVLEQMAARCGYRQRAFYFHGTGREEHFIPWHYRLAMKTTRALLPHMADGVIAEFEVA